MHTTALHLPTAAADKCRCIAREAARFLLVYSSILSYAHAEKYLLVCDRRKAQTLRHVLLFKGQPFVWMQCLVNHHFGHCQEEEQKAIVVGLGQVGPGEPPWLPSYQTVLRIAAGKKKRMASVS